jgi:hypothetical protein
MILFEPKFSVQLDQQKTKTKKNDVTYLYTRNGLFVCCNICVFEFFVP